MHVRVGTPCEHGAAISLWVVTWLVASAAGVTNARSEAPRYRLRASVSLVAPHVDGTVDVTFTNTSPSTLHDAVFFLFPNRFSTPDPGINDFNRPFIYPEEDFDPGSMEVLEARDAGEPIAIQPWREPQLPDGTAVRLPIAPLPPGATRTLTLRFQTRVPYRFGSFGRFDQQLTMNGGWYPYLAALDADGAWRTDWPPPLADFDVHLTVPPALELVLNGRHFSRQPFVDVTVLAVHYLSLVAAAELLRAEIESGGTRIVLFRWPERYVSRISPEPPPTEILLDTVRDILARRPAGVPAPPDELVVVEAPLRLDLTAPGEGAVLVSDRALKVHWLLRPFHELQIAQSVYAELLRSVERGETTADYPWVREGLSRVLAWRFVNQARPGTRSVQDWIELFNIFAIVDRFESVPKVPFVEAFFERARVADPLHAEIRTFNSSLPPGRVIMEKLQQLVGEDTFNAIVQQCAGAVNPFRECVAATAGRDLKWFFDQWLQPYPALNYRFDAVDLDQPAPPGFRSTVSIRRESSRPVAEPVTVRLRSIGGRYVDVRWNGDGDVGQVSGDTSFHVCQAVIDPERKLMEDRRDDNYEPPEPQVVLDTAEVEISSTEFGISGLVVGRARYDYRKDLALAAFYTNRSIGFTAGARAHWGAPIDATTYHHNLYAFYGFQALDASFEDKRRPAFRTTGQLDSLGFRYDYTNLFSYDNPSHERNVRLYADWYDQALGSDFNYVDWGAHVTLTQPLWSYRTVAAAQVVNGFSEPLGSSLVPNQGLYSLGGSLSIRGIGAEEELGRNIFLIRSEIRQDIYPELDLNLLDLLVLRRTQLRVFADSGRVSNSAAKVYDVGGYAVGVGVGLAAVYEFMGFFPSVAYIEMATRVDDAKKASDVQFLFGTRQAF
ncbi:MAG: BamA/TamA family outer membrane protein [Candidatus Binatia bacterium]|jgi:hypothetical protein